MKLAVCPKCNQIPSIHANLETLDISCSCSYQGVISSKEYMKLLQMSTIYKHKCELIPRHSDIEGVEYCIQCKKWLCSDCLITHNEIKELKQFSTTHMTTSLKNTVAKKCLNHTDRQFTHFCEDCDMHFCNSCLSEHQGHHFNSITKYNDYISPEYIKKVKEDMKEAESYLIKYYAKLSEEYIKKPYARIKQIEELLKKNKHSNEEILKVIKLILDNYSINQMNNYHIIGNIIQNTTFKLEEYDKALGQEKIINFLKNNIIIFHKKLTKTIKAHDNWIYSILLLQDGRLASCSEDNTIKIFNLSTFNCDLVISGHHKSVYYLAQLDNGKVLSCSFDKTIKLWTIFRNTGNCEATLRGHERDINKVIPLTNGRFASCSGDHTIKIWKNEPPYECIFNINSSRGPVFSIIQLLGKEILISDEVNNNNHDRNISDSIYIWDLTKYEQKKVIHNVSCSASRHGLQELKKNKLIVGGKNTVTVLETNSFQIVMTISDSFFEYVYSFLDMGNYILFGTSGGDIFQLKIPSYQYNLIKKSAHRDGIKCIIQIKPKILFATASEDQTLKFWE